MEGQEARLARKDNLGKMTKGEKSRFTQRGVIVSKCSDKSYLVKGESGRIVKKSYNELKGFVVM